MNVIFLVISWVECHSVCSSHSRFFKKREQEKQRKKPRAEGDNESVEDVDDDEFERALGKQCVSVSVYIWTVWQQFLNTCSDVVSTSLDSYEGDNYFPDFKDTDLDFAG